MVRAPSRGGLCERTDEVYDVGSALQSLQKANERGKGSPTHIRVQAGAGELAKIARGDRRGDAVGDIISPQNWVDFASSVGCTTPRIEGGRNTILVWFRYNPYLRTSEKIRKKSKRTVYDDRTSTGCVCYNTNKLGDKY